MIFDEMGLPKDSGATDFNDSARLAGIIALFQYPTDRYLWLTEYINDAGKYIRHPKEYKYNFSRDQAVCLMAGLWFNGLSYLVDKKAITGKDFLSPSVRGHIRRCQGKKATKFQDYWLKLDIYYNAFFDPLSEPNQLICMLMVAGPEYVKLWTKLNTKWKQAITDYWCGWRGESGLAVHMINKIEGICDEENRQTMA